MCKTCKEANHSIPAEVFCKTPRSPSTHPPTYSSKTAIKTRSVTPPIPLTMDQAHAVLVGFPHPSSFDNNELYHDSILAHRKNLDKLTSSPGWSDYAPQLLEVIHPAVHSLSYLVVLNTVKASNAYPPDALLEKITRFVSSFDQRQLRYGGRYFARLIQQPRLVDLFPVSCFN